MLLKSSEMKKQKNTSSFYSIYVLTTAFVWCPSLLWLCGSYKGCIFSQSTDSSLRQLHLLSAKNSEDSHDLLTVVRFCHGSNNINPQQRMVNWSMASHSHSIGSMCLSYNEVHVTGIDPLDFLVEVILLLHSPLQCGWKHPTCYGDPTWAKAQSSTQVWSRLQDLWNALPILKHPSVVCGYLLIVNSTTIPHTAL